MTPTIDQIMKWRDSMINDCMDRLPDQATPEERKVFRYGLSVGWREAINILKIQGALGKRQHRGG